MYVHALSVWGDVFGCSLCVFVCLSEYVKKRAWVLSVRMCERMSCKITFGIIEHSYESFSIIYGTYVHLVSLSQSLIASITINQPESLLSKMMTLIL